MIFRFGVNVSSPSPNNKRNPKYKVTSSLLRFIKVNIVFNFFHLLNVHLQHSYLSSFHSAQP